MEKNCTSVNASSCAEEDSGQWVPIVGFDCRGLEPVGFHPEVGKLGS